MNITKSKMSSAIMVLLLLLLPAYGQAQEKTNSGDVAEIVQATDAADATKTLDAADAAKTPDVVNAVDAANDADEFKMIDHPIAILPFTERGKEVQEMGRQVSDLMFANLVVDPSLYLVEREHLDKTLQEAELNLSGIVNPNQANAIGQLTGARLIVTGSVFQIDKKIYLVAKVIGTETSRVVGASVNGRAMDGLDGLANRLAEKVIATIRGKSDSLVAKRVSPEDRIAALKKTMGAGQRPTVFISVKEEHVNREVIDPAAETELTLFCTETGFEVVDSEKGDADTADYLIKGEGISEFATRHGNLVSVKARLEIKVIERSSGKVLAIDRQTRVAVDLVENIAGKKALQDAAADIAMRILPKIPVSGK